MARIGPVSRRRRAGAAPAVMLAMIVVGAGVLAAPGRAADPALAGGAQPVQAAVPTHPAQLTPLIDAEEFPRCTPEELAAAGYPDPLHAFAWPGFTPLVDATGETYGPGSLVRGQQVLPREGLAIAADRIAYRGIQMSFDPGYQDWQMLPMVEMLDWARRDIAVLLGHDRPDTLHVINPDNLDHYRELTGFEFHRLYRWQDEAVVIEPGPILLARGLAAHAARELITRWQVDDLTGGRALPAWLVQGLAWYLAEDGTHFLNYLFMYRARMPVILDPADTEAVLTAAPHPDPDTDKVQYRMAGYSAFLMAWELVEHRGGLEPVRDFLRRVGAGEDPDAVSRDLWGHPLDALATELDATARPEPVGAAVEPRTPHRPPAD